MEVNLRTAEENKDVQVVEVSGRIDAYTVTVLDEEIEALIGVGSSNLVCNTAQVEYVSGRGLEMFLKRIKEAREQGGDLKLACLQPAVRRTFDLAGFSKMAHLYGTEAEAVTDFTAGRTGASPFHTTMPGGQGPAAGVDATLIGDAAPADGVDATLIGDADQDIHVDATLVGDVSVGQGIHVDATLMGGPPDEDDSLATVDPAVEHTIFENIQRTIDLEQTLIGQSADRPPSGEIDIITGEEPALAEVEGGTDALENEIRACINRLRPFRDRDAYGSLMREMLAQGLIRTEESPVSSDAGEPIAPVETAGGAQLLQMLGAGRTGAVSLSDRKITIGRDDTNTMSIASPEVSKVHTSISFVDDEFIVADLGSKNGTSVNGERVPKAVLRHGDLVGVGPALFLFLCEPGAETPAEERPRDTETSGHGGPTGNRVVCTQGSMEGEIYAVEDLPVLIGRGPTCSVVLTDESVAEYHVQLSPTAGGVRLVDLKTQSGSFVNGQRVQRRALEPGDQIRLGSAEFRYEAGTEADSEAAKGGGPRLVGRSGPAAGLVCRIGRHPIVIGRAVDAQIQITDDSVSRQHARIEQTPDGVTITDLGSVNGVIVNGAKVSSCQLQAGDTIKLGVAEFVFQR